MKTVFHKFAILSIALCSVTLMPWSTGPAQVNNADSHLELIASYALPAIKGRIDHMAFNPKQQIIYVAALGNNTVEAVDAKSGKVIHSIKGLSEPQGIRFIQETNAIFVANAGNGECNAYNSVTYQQTGSIKLNSDADNVRYSPATGKIYVGYGDGGIAVIDPKNLQMVADIKLPAHPESFQIDEDSKKMFVNVPDAHLIEVIDLEKNSITDNWKIEDASSNFPMALDAGNHRLFIGCRKPAKLLVTDTDNGKPITSVNIDGDTDDVFYNTDKKQVYVSCGAGYLDVITQVTKDNYNASSRIETQPGARTSLFIPELNQLIIAARAGSGNQARLMVYKIR